MSNASPKLKPSSKRLIDARKREFRNQPMPKTVPSSHLDLRRSRRLCNQVVSKNRRFGDPTKPYAKALNQMRSTGRYARCAS